MEIQLVKPEDVESEKREDMGEITTIDEFFPDNDMVDIIIDALTVSMQRIIDQGFKLFAYHHPRYGREVKCLFKDGQVIVIDYNGTNVAITEILPENEANEFIEIMEDQVGEDGLWS